MTTVDWLAFVPIALGISLVPGANQLLGLRNSYRNGLRTAMIAVGGRLVAFAIMIVLVALGLGAVLVQSEMVFSTVKWAGVAYLFYLGVRRLWSSWRRPAESTSPVGTDPTPGGVLALGREEFLVAAGNPKAVLLFAALLSQFVSGPGSTVGGLLLVGTGHLVVETLVALLYAVLGSQLRRIVISARVDRLVARVTGVCLIGFAAYLGTSQRPS
ncbi:LysE family translocator [Actinomadura vinacea]|uniref:LysE family translocator n=1 Tax=Actinomadura vinacea TaxID=115336 RepID=A0ABN3JT42_9ACTN